MIHYSVTPFEAVMSTGEDSNQLKFYYLKTKDGILKLKDPKDGVYEVDTLISTDPKSFLKYSPGKKVKIKHKS